MGRNQDIRISPTLASKDVFSYFVDLVVSTNGTAPVALSSSSKEVAEWICQYCSQTYVRKIDRVIESQRSACLVCQKIPRSAIQCECGGNCFPPIRKPPLLNKSAADLFCGLASEFHPLKNGCLKLSKLRPNSAFKVWWQCKKCNNEWDAILANRTRLGAGCPECAKAKSQDLTRGRIKPPKPGQSLQDRFPKIARYWHPTKNDIAPLEIGAGVETSYWWLCERGHESYGTPNAKINKMKKNGGSFPCRECEPFHRSTPKPGRSLAEVFPETAKFWHPTANGDLTPKDVTAHANTYVNWLCEKGHTTNALVNSRVNGHTCGECNIAVKSKIEGLFRDTIRDTGLLSDVAEGNTRLMIPLRNRKSMQVDICGMSADGSLVVIEYDGEYYHSDTAKQAMDIEKTNALLNAGYKVVRIREHALPYVELSHANLFQVNHDFAPRIKMRYPESIACTLALIASWLQE